MEIQAYQVVKQDDGRYTAGLNFINDAGEIIKRTTVTASTKDEFKDQIRIFKTKIEEIEAHKQILLTVVQNAIDEVMAE